MAVHDANLEEHHAQGGNPLRRDSSFAEGVTRALTAKAFLLVFLFASEATKYEGRGESGRYPMDHRSACRGALAPETTTAATSDNWKIEIRKSGVCQEVSNRWHA